MAGYIVVTLGCNSLNEPATQTASAVGCVSLKQTHPLWLPAPLGVSLNFFFMPTAALVEAESIP